MGSEFFEMGKYAAFIWTAYGVSLGALLALGIFSYRKLKTLEAQVEKLKSKE